MKRIMSPVLDLFAYECGMPNVLGLSIGMEYDEYVHDIIVKIEDYCLGVDFFPNVNRTLEEYQVRLEYDTDEDERFLEKIYLTLHSTDVNDLNAIIQYLDRETCFDNKDFSVSVVNNSDDIDIIESASYEYYNNEFSTKVEYDDEKQTILVTIEAETSTSGLLRKIYEDKRTKKIFHNNKLVTIADYITDIETKKRVFLFFRALKDCLIEDIPLVSSVIQSKIDDYKM